MSITLSSDTAHSVVHEIRRLLDEFHLDPSSPLESEVQQAVYLARYLQQRADRLQTPEERRQQAELDRMMNSPGDKATLMQLTDQAFRSRLPYRSADQLIHILDVQGIPRFFSTLDRTLLKGFQSFGDYLPSLTMPMVKEKMQHETANVVLPAEEELLHRYLSQRKEEGLRMNVNFLGEALLGEEDAQRRLQAYLQALQRPEIEMLSVKISTIYSQILPLASEHSIDVLCDRLELLYRAAAKSQFVRHDGLIVPKFVYLDMEEYRDKYITAEAFMRTLDREGLDNVEAGIALQAYVPDSFPTQQQLTEWARRRVEAGGAPITIRLVKGANMEMEQVEASLNGWPQAPFPQKVDTDANYKRMLRYGMQPENLAAARLGIASHNLFTLAYGLVLATKAEAHDHVQFEMLEGMANHQRRALFELSQNMLLYAPACRQEEFTNAIGYLVRRLDENTGPDNFLRHAFSLKVDSPEWNKLQTAFLDSFSRMESVSSEPRRQQDRRTSKRDVSAVTHASQPFTEFYNEPDTDWSLPHNSQWAEELVARWKDFTGKGIVNVPLVIAGEEILASEQSRTSVDPSRPGKAVANVFLATEQHVMQAVACARDDPQQWRKRSVHERRELLFATAENLAARRGDLMGAMMAEGGKLFPESDPEVSEAMDFCRFYALAAEYFHKLPGLQPSAKGAVAVVSPWNFPLAIPCGGVAASLAAGNNVILKPATDTALIAYELCKCFWDAGVPKTALQLLPASGYPVGQQLVTHDNVDAVVLTGGTATALQMLAAKPTINLFAETGGKNATIVTALSDRDMAIKNVLHSAFSHSGQKCSATSLMILEEEVYHDRAFRDAFCDAVESLRVGSAWDLHTRVNPLIRPPRDELERGLKELEPGESWAVMPRLHVDDNPHLVSPGVKWDVRPQSITHCTEFFGPLLAVMPARDLHEAIELVNATGYGLTSGLESLDDREQRIWQEGIHAGNLYINRSTTGAIVLRQPFGGMGKSAIGPGIKAGGPNYVAQLMDYQHNRHSNQQSADLGDSGLDEFCEALRGASQHGRIARDAAEQIVAAAQDYEHWMAVEFEPAHDHFRLVGEDNFRRYLPMREICVRVAPADSQFEIFARALASRTSGCRTVVSSPPNIDSPAVELLDELTDSWAGAIEFIQQTDEQLAEAIRQGHLDRLRYARAERVPKRIRQAAAEVGFYIADQPVHDHGRVELLWYFQEQSLTHLYHRYGNLGIRTGEERAPVR